MKLTQAIAAKMTLAPGKAEVIYWDDDLKGFGLRVREGGSKKWVIQYRVGKKAAAPHTRQHGYS